LIQLPVFVVLADLSAEQRAWFEPLRQRAHIAFGARIADIAIDLRNAEALYVWGHPHDPWDNVLAAAPALRWVHYTGAGAEHLLTPRFVRSRIRLTNSRGVHTPGVAELAVALLLALAKHLPTRVRAQMAHEWTQELNAGVSGKSVVIVGVGSIGSAVARAARALDMHVIGVRTSARPARWAHEVIAFTDLDFVLPGTDYVVLCAPETSATRGLFDARRLRLLPRGAILVNVARGGLVDEPALIEALQDGHLAGAGLDVFAHEPLDRHSPLWDMPNVLITPHYPNVRGWEKPTVQRFVDNAERFLAGRPLRDLVDKRRGY
jgi:phosphoglycerate dehydrogenase-like enzyme